MRRLCSVLGMPQHRFASIHIVGTNGKTSVARMTAALLEAHGVRAGAYLSPHIHSWRERILIAGESISEHAFAEALERAEQAAEVADRSAGEEGPVTQYELLTAAAFVAFAAAKVQVAAIEAGLGGRLDATNVIPSKATVLTSVGRDHTVLITGPLSDEVEEVVDREVERHHAKRLAPFAGSTTDSPIGFPALNFMLAETAAREVLGRDLESDASRRVQGEISIPGRAEVVGGDPPVILDAAHNAQGARALAELLPGLAEGGEVVACLAILEEKDAEGIVNALAPHCAHMVCSEIPAEAMEGSGRPGARSHGVAELAALARAAGAEAEAIADPERAWERARELAHARGAVALAAGSHYLLARIWTERPEENC